MDATSMLLLHLSICMFQIPYFTTWQYHLIIDIYNNHACISFALKQCGVAFFLAFHKFPQVAILVYFKRN